MFYVTGKHGIVFQPPITWRQWEASGKNVWCCPHEARRWQQAAAQEAHEKRYGKPKPETGADAEMRLQLPLEKAKRGAATAKR